MPLRAYTATVRISALVAVIACACASGRPERPPVSPTALRGVILALPTPQDARKSDNIGCGQFAPQLPEAVARAVVASLGETGASFAQQAPWVLTLSVTFAGTGDEYVGAPRGPPQFGGAPAGLAFEERSGGVNAGWDDTSLALDATLERGGGSSGTGRSPGTPGRCPAWRTGRSWTRRRRTPSSACGWS